MIKQNQFVFASSSGTDDLDCSNHLCGFGRKCIFYLAFEFYLFRILYISTYLFAMLKFMINRTEAHCQMLQGHAISLSVKAYLEWSWDCRFRILFSTSHGDGKRVSLLLPGNGAVPETFYKRSG